MQTRRGFLTVVGTFCLALPLHSWGQRGKRKVVGWLALTPPDQDRQFLEAVKDALRSLGYVDGRDVIFEYRSANGNPTNLPSAARELVSLRPDVIVSGATPGTTAAKHATSTIALVMVGVADPVGAGFVASLSRPGGNVTGITNIGNETVAKTLEILRAVIPSAVRIGVLAPDNPSIPVVLKTATDAAKSMGLTAVPAHVKTMEDVERMFRSMVADRVDAVVVLSDTFAIVNRVRIAQLAAAARLPTIYGYESQVESGGLMSFGPNPERLPVAVADYIDKILKGANPGDLPVQQPAEFTLAINMKAAAQLGITFPQEIVLRAQRVVQ